MSSSSLPGRLRPAAAGLLFLSATLLGACSKFGLFELLPPRSPLRVSGGETACLQDAGVRITDYLDGNGTAAEVQEMFQCVDDSIQLFLERTKTSTPGVYQPTELRNFLEKFFFGEARISSELMAETMEFKRSILGGRGDLLTSDELRTLRRIVSGFRDQMLKLEVHRPLTLERLSGLPTEQQDAVLADIKQGLADFGTLLAETSGDYPIIRLEGLFTEFEKVYPSEALRSLVDRLPLIRAMKPVLMGTSQDEFRPEEWPRFLVSLGRLLGIYVKSRPLLPDEQGIFSVKAGCGAGREKLSAAMLDLFAMFDEAVRHHGGLRMIPFVELDRVFDQFKPGDLGKVKPVTAKRLMRPVFRKFLAGLNEGFLGREAEGLTRLGLDRARRAFLDWSDNQRYIEGVFSSLGRFDCGDLADRTGQLPRYLWSDIESVPIETAMGVARVQDLHPRTQASVQAFRGLISRIRPQQGSSGIMMEIDALRPSMRHTFNSLSVTNVLGVGYVLGQQGYRDRRNDAVRKAAGQPQAMAGPEIDALSNDLRDISIDLQFMDPNGPEGGGARFRDGNLFTYSGNGDQVLDMLEGVELFSLLLSGQEAGTNLHRLLEKECPSIGGGVFETQIIEKECAIEYLFDHLDEVYPHLPGLRAHLEALAAQRPAGSIRDSATLFLEQLFRIATKGSQTPQYVGLLEFHALSVIPHYMEVTFVSYDADRNGVLNTDEALAAFPKFEPVLRQMANDPSLSRSDLEALFAYLLDRGRAPETTLEKLGFLLWSWRGRDDWNLRVPRKRILDIFEQLQ
jgi:hypothetical protein